MKALFVALLLVIPLVGCTGQEQADYKRGQKEADQGHFRIALGFFDKVVKRNKQSPLTLEAAREAARISFYEIKDFERSIAYYQFIVLNSPDADERLKAQRQVASIYVENIQDYKASIKELSKLVVMETEETEKAQAQLSIARSFYYLNDFGQSLSEVEAILKSRIDINTRFSTLLLKGNILVAQKNFTGAANLFQEIIEEYPERSIEENVPISLAVCYEEANDYKSAIRILESHRDRHPNPEYIDIRIKRLSERQKNAPGAKGFRK